MVEKLKRFLEDDVLYFGLILVVVAVGAFGLGRQSTSIRVAATEPPVRIEYPALVPQAGVTAVESTVIHNLTVVGSKNGTKYHLLNCPGAKQIAEKNLVSFSSVAEAEAAGYSPAANCPGL